MLKNKCNGKYARANIMANYIKVNIMANMQRQMHIKIDILTIQRTAKKAINRELQKGKSIKNNR